MKYVDGWMGRWVGVQTDAVSSQCKKFQHNWEVLYVPIFCLPNYIMEICHGWSELKVIR